MTTEFDLQYTYSASRAKALESELLNENQLERLVGAKDMSEITMVLQDTFLSDLLPSGGASVFDLSHLLRKSLSRAKQTISSIAPDPAILDVLWLRYDYYNLKTIVKGRRAGLSDEEIIERCFFAAKYDPRVLLDYASTGRLGNLHKEMSVAYEKALESLTVYGIDVLMNRGYFIHVRKCAVVIDNEFVSDYVAFLTDFFNLQAQLRLVTLRHLTVPEAFIQGGRFTPSDLDSVEKIYAAFETFGDAFLWTEAIARHRDRGEYLLLQKVMDDYELKFVQEHGRSIFSFVPLFAFFIARRNNLQIVRTIVTAKQAGMDERDLRVMLRRLYA
ncbi:MAG: V-type ATPase subunit [Candidatus Moranbacteria bacterium]|nr:V-type ATPase subunit [Candidatus Moranbacteria bacterium]